MRIDRTILMHWKCARICGLVALATVFLTMFALADDDKAIQQEQAIRAAAKECLAALASGNAKALAACWTADGEYIDELGNAHPADQLVSDALKSAGDDSKPKIKVTASKIRFLTSNVAVEDGSSKVVWPDAEGVPPVTGHLHATWVKQGERWRLARLCEIPGVAPANSSLAELAWMVGTWTAISGDATLEATVRWNDDGTFLLRDTKAVQDGRVVLRGTQRIGLDPQTGKLMSWSFDSGGGHTEAVWTKDGGSWVEQATGVLPDGRPTSATAFITFEGNDSYIRKLRAAQIQGEPVPDQELRFTRQGDPQR
jgi:uncharacterized protein (TIGR02246 family)